MDTGEWQRKRVEAFNTLVYEKPQLSGKQDRNGRRHGQDLDALTDIFETLDRLVEPRFDEGYRCEVCKRGWKDQGARDDHVAWEHRRTG